MIKSSNMGFKPYRNTQNQRPLNQNHIWTKEVFFQPISIPILSQDHQNQRQNQQYFESQLQNIKIISLTCNQILQKQGKHAQRKKRISIPQEILDNMCAMFEEREMTKKSIRTIAIELNLEYPSVFRRYVTFCQEKRKNQGGRVFLKVKNQIRGKTQQLIRILLTISEKQQFSQNSHSSLSEVIKNLYGQTFSQSLIAKYWKLVREDKQKAQNLISNEGQSKNWQPQILTTFQSFAKNGVQMLFLTINYFQTVDHKMMVLMVLSGDQGIVFRFWQKRENDVERQIKYVLFCAVLNYYQAEYGLKERWVIIARDQDIYQNKFGEVVVRQVEQQVFSNTLLARGGNFFCLPPKFGFFSFGSNYKPVAPKNELLSLEEMHQQMMYFKQHYPNSQGPLNVANESKSQMSCEESNDMD